MEPKIVAVAVEPALSFLAGPVLRRFGFSMLGWVVMVSSIGFSLTGMAALLADQGTSPGFARPGQRGRLGVRSHGR